MLDDISAPQRLHYVERNSSCRLNLGRTRDDVGRQFANAFEHTFVLISPGRQTTASRTALTSPENDWLGRPCLAYVAAKFQR